MRTAVQITADSAPWKELVDYVVVAEAMGVDIVWVAEAWGTDAATPLGYLSAHTSRIRLGAGVFQLGVRSAAMIAQTALTLSIMSRGRFLLGLGTSGPQVIEGLHGVAFDRPLTRMRETLDVIDMALSGEKLVYSGETVRLPRPGGEGKPLRITGGSPHPVPIYLAALSPRMLELTGERADGWLGTSFIPESADTSLGHVRTGAIRAGRSLDAIDICQGAEVAFAGDETELGDMVRARKPGLAYSLGGMGSATTNFYNRAYARQGYAEVAAESQRLWLKGERTGAAAAIPDQMVLATTLIGTEEMVADRLRVWADAGVTTVRLYPAGDTLEDRLSTLERALDLVPR